MANQELSPVEPENELVCRAKELGIAMEPVSALAHVVGTDQEAVEARALIQILKSLEELRMTIRVQKETVHYEIEARVSPR